jgi:hypothetical protein
MPRALEPERLIQTTLAYEGKSASFIWAEGVSRRALKELFRSPLLRDQDVVSSAAREKHVSAVAWAAQCIDDPFNRRNAPLDPVDVWNGEVPWAGPLLDSKQVVITRSPPTLTSFKLLAHGASLVVVGVWLGSELAHAAGVPLLTFVSVPAGMMVVGAASGIGKGLETGLSQWLVGKMTSARRTRQRLKPKPKAKRKTDNERLAELVRKRAPKGSPMIVLADQTPEEMKRDLEQLVVDRKFRLSQRKPD